jgi:hypothetical protein
VPLVRVGQRQDDKSWTHYLDHTVRRDVSRHRHTTITGISWVHDRVYTRTQANSLLETGLKVWFSDYVRSSSLTPNVVDVVVYQGKTPPAGFLYRKQLQLDAGDEEYTKTVRITFETGEQVQIGDRVQILVKGDFILDRCCRAIDGNNLGGRVPTFGTDDVVDDDDPCATPPGRPGRWTSGNGVEGGTFESWFSVETDDTAKITNAEEAPA